jgi:hypothetical protein
MHTTVVNSDRSAYHLWGDRASTSPSLDDCAVFETKRRHFFGEFGVDEWAFF